MSTTSPYRSLPKVELHCRLEGTVRPETVSALARCHGVDLGVRHPSELYRHRVRSGFAAVLGTVCSVLRCADDFNRIAYEASIDAARAGVRYRELLVSPALHLDRGVGFEALWDGLAAGLAEAETDCGLVTRVILAIDPSRGVDGARQVVDLARSRPRDLLIGIGSDPAPTGPVAAALGPVIGDAARNGLLTTAHCGGLGPIDDIATLVAAGIDRLDHGIRLMEDPDLLDRVLAGRIPVTVCPSADVDQGRADGLAAHPFPDLRRAGVLVALGSDVPAFLSYDLGDEYLRVADAFGLTLDDLLAISLDGVEAAWLDPCDRSVLADRFRAEAAAVVNCAPEHGGERSGPVHRRRPV